MAKVTLTFEDQQDNTMSITEDFGEGVDADNPTPAQMAAMLATLAATKWATGELDEEDLINAVKNREA